MPEPGLAGWLAALRRLLPATVLGSLKKFPDPPGRPGAEGPTVFVQAQNPKSTKFATGC